jgi:hypothetical protein
MHSRKNAGLKPVGCILRARVDVLIFLSSIHMAFGKKLFPTAFFCGLLRACS